MKVGYCRVSTGEQEDALVQQVSRIQKTGVVKVYQDIESGKSDKRKQFNQLLNDVKLGLITEIVITRIDRLARSVITIHKNIKLFEDHKVKLTILDSPIGDLDSPFGWLQINQMAGLAEFELRMIQDRIKHGYNHFHEQNKASSKPPFGYIRVNEKYAPDHNITNVTGKSNWQIARDIVDYFLDNFSTLRATAGYIQLTYKLEWSTPGLKYWLSNLVLQGDTCYNIKGNQSHPEKWDIRPNTHLPLITREEGKLIQSQLKENKSKWGHNTGTKVGSWLLAGQVYCGDCGYKCFLFNKRATLPVRCRKRNHFGSSFCSNKSVTHLFKIIDAVDTRLTEYAKELTNYVASHRSTIEVNPEIANLQARLTTLKPMAGDEDIDVAIHKLTIRLHTLQSEAPKVKTLNDEKIKLFLKYFADKNYWEVIPESIKSEVYKMFVSKVIVLNGNIINIELVDILS